MRHRKSGKKLNRNSSHRQAMFRNMAVSLIEHEVIKTTLVKAKELRRFAEPLITLSKEDNVANRRLVFNRTRSKAAVGKLFTQACPAPTLRSVFLLKSSWSMSCRKSVASHLKEGEQSVLRKRNRK